MDGSFVYAWGHANAYAYAYAAFSQGEATVMHPFRRIWPAFMRSAQGAVVLLHSAFLNAFMFFFLYESPSPPSVCIRAYTRMHPFAYSANRSKPVAFTDTLLERRSHLAPIVA